MKLAKFRREILKGKRPALTDDISVKEGQEVIIERDDDGYPTVWVTVGKRTKADTWAYVLHWFRPDYMGKLFGGTVHRPAQAFAIRGEGGFEPERLDGETVATLARDNKQRFIRHLIEEERG